MRNWKAIIFDMDGTLFDTETISMKAWKRVGETLQLPTSDEFILSLIGRTRKDQQVVFDSYMPKDWPQEEACSLHTQFKKEDKLKNGVPLMGDVKGLLDTVKTKGYTIAMATSASAEDVEFNLNNAGTTVVMIPDKVQPTKEIKAMCNYILKSLDDLKEIV